MNNNKKKSPINVPKATWLFFLLLKNRYCHYYGVTFLFSRWLYISICFLDMNNMSVHILWYELICPFISYLELKKFFTQIATFENLYLISNWFLTHIKLLVSVATHWFCFSFQVHMFEVRILEEGQRWWRETEEKRERKREEGKEGGKRD